MADYDLDVDEAVILQETGISTGKFDNTDLILTNKNIIQVNRGILGGVKNLYKYPLANLKTLNGKANVLIGKGRNGSKQLELYFADGEKYFRFNHWHAENNWAREIIKAHKNRMAEIAEKQKQNQRETKSVFESLTETIESAKGIFNVKRTPIQKTCKCPKCGDELTGNKGSEVECSYCGTKVIIK